MKRLRIRSRAREDIRETRDWYENKIPGLGRRFGAELDIAIRSLFVRPEMYRPVHGEIRRP
jgi:plasmid stabilization system protein ParE